MNIWRNKYTKNISYAMFSNIFSFIISSILVLIVPKMLGIKEYGYWQLYTFYVSYVGFFHFGWIDGIYLRLGGREYRDLNKKKLATQFWCLFIFEILIICMIYIYARNYINDMDKRSVLYLTCLCGIITIEKTFILFVLQATNRIKEYAWLTLIEKIIYSIIVITLLFLGNKNYKTLILSDVFAKCIVLMLSIQICKDIIFTNFISLKELLKEAWININIGIKLMIANIASMLIVGLVRFAIENHWDIETFGKVSFTMTVSNILMVFIGAISVIMFPMLRRLEEHRLAIIYQVMRTLIMILLLLLLILYYPIKALLIYWLPQYIESLKYMAIMFPICIYESKISLLVNTYLKTIRKEGTLLWINFISLLLSTLLTIISVYLLNNLMMSVFMIVVVIAFKSTLAEVLLSKYLKISAIKNITLEITLTLLFMFGNLFLHEIISVVIYIITYMIYLIVNKSNIRLMINEIKKISINFQIKENLEKGSSNK